MVSLTPCRRCHLRTECTRRSDILASLRGLDITKANVKCAIPEQDFPAGAAVIVQAWELAPNSNYFAEDWARVAVAPEGVIAGWKDQKATVVLDVGQEIERPDGGHAIAILRAQPDRLTRLNRPTAEMCACGMLTVLRCHAKQFPPVRGEGPWFCPAEAGSMMDDADGY